MHHKTNDTEGFTTIERMELIILDLIDMLEESGWSKEQMEEEFNSLESHLTAGAPDNRLTEQEMQFLFGEDE